MRPLISAVASCPSYLRPRGSARAAGLVLAAGWSAAIAQPVTLAPSTVSEDRWMYPFNATPGSRFTAAVFGAPEVPGFDDRDGQFIVGRTTAPAITAGLAPTEYHIISVQVTASISTGNAFSYDATPDALETYFADTDPDFIPDPDAGRVIELFPVGYRSGFTNASWMENSPFSTMPPVVDPVQGNRTAFAAEFDGMGVATDASNNLRERREVVSAALGLADLAPGTRVPADTEFVFDVNLNAPGVRDSIQRSLANGVLRFAISSLHLTNFDPDNPGGGPGALTYPIFYTSENPLAQVLGTTPTMSLTVWVGSRADFDQSGTVDIFDLLAYLEAWNNGNPFADIDDNGTLNVFDIIGFLTEFNAG